jgi:DNA gyrase/topoisomerase IV subunit A
MSIDKNGTIIITALPSSKSVDHVRKIIEKEILLDKADLRDESTYDTRIVIEKVYKKQCNMQELYKRLYQKLQATETYNMAFFDQKHIYVPCSFSKVVKTNLQYLIDTHNNRLAHQIKDNEDKLEVLQIIEKLKKTNNWKNIFDLTHEEALNYLISKFGCSNEVAQNVFKKPISYLTKSHEQEITELENLINKLKEDKSDIYEMLLKKYKNIKTKISKEIAKNETTFIKAK